MQLFLLGLKFYPQSVTRGEKKDIMDAVHAAWIHPRRERFSKEPDAIKGDESGEDEELADELP